MPSVPPAGGSNPSQPTEPENSDNTPAPPAMSGGSGGGGMTAFMETFTPEQRRKFMNILVQNLVREIQKASKKAIEELRKEREEIENG